MRATVPAPPPLEAFKPARLSLDEILDKLSDIARDDQTSAGDRMKAFKAIASMQSSAVVLPEPLTDHEMIKRFVRLFEGARSNQIVQLAYREAYPNRRKIEDTPAQTVDTLPPELMEEALGIISLPLLYRAFPDIKRSGQPPTYPRGGSLAEQKKWCQRAAVKLILEREQNKSDGRPSEAI